MATYAQISRGTGDSYTTKELQKALNRTGRYNLQEDGIFGAKTEAALRDWQNYTGQAVDGIAGENTWASFDAQPQGGSQSKENTAQAPTPEKTYRYNAEEDEVYQQALQGLTKVKDKAPVLAGTFDDQVSELFDRIMNREDFSYDLNGDALWQQHKDQYTQQGKLAMMDAMGQAAALTGGYGSSYAQGVGQQTYQGYLQQLNDKVPELYQLALQKHNNDQALLQDQLAAARQMQADEYGRYQDALSQHNLEIDRAQGAVDTAYNRGNDAWLTEEQLRRQDEETAYSRRMDAYNKLVNMIAGTGYSPSQEELEAAGMAPGEAAALAMQYDREQAAAAAASAAKYSAKNVKEEKTLDTDELYQWKERFANAASEEEAEELAQEMELLGIDQDTVYYLYDNYLGNKEQTKARLKRLADTVSGIFAPYK